MKIKYRSPMHLDTHNAQLGTKHGVHCRLTMGLMIGTTCLYSNFGSGGVDSGRSLNEFRKQEWSQSWFFKEIPEWSRSNFLTMRLACLFIIIIVIIAGCFFTKHVIM